MYFLFDQSARDFGRPTYGIIPILSQDKKSTIYIKTKNWGVTGETFLEHTSYIRANFINDEFVLESKPDYTI